MPSHPNKPIDPLGADRLGDRIRCPKDGTIMERVSVPGPTGTVTVDRCAGCGGLWFDPLELGHTLASKGQPSSLDTGALEERPHNVKLGQNLGGMVCPRDGSPLAKTRHLQQQHVVLDQCPTCGGVLLDAGELKDISEFTIGEKIKGLVGRGK
jgi:Zn-finger nucleic acid-binding protein